MNRLDSELVAGALSAAGHEILAERRGADAVLYNTCSVRQHAEQKVFSRLGADAQRKADGRRLLVGVLGCLAQRQGRQLVRQYPCVDVVCSPNQIWRLPELLAQAAAGQSPQLALDPERSSTGAPPTSDSDSANPQPACRQAGPKSEIRNPKSAIQNPKSPASPSPMDALDLSRDPDAAPSRSQAFVRVARGCDKFCSYCIVPFVRGREQSRPPNDILTETRRLVDAGRSEITLLGQTVNGYRYQTGETSTRFSQLLEKVSAVPGLRRLRFVTSHPIDFGDDILAAMRDLPNVCPYIHCPAQSGSDAVLKRMNRRYTRAQYDDLVDRARATVPGVVLAGDFIVGFPGETDADHAASADLIRRSGYKNSFIFQYSPRPGTAAARRLADDVPRAVKKRRNHDLLAVQESVSLAHHESHVGQTVEVLVEGPSPRSDRQPVPPPPGQTQLIGRTPGDHIVVFNAPATLANSYAPVRITAATALTLFGEVC